MAIPKLALIPSGVKAGKLYSVLPTNGDGDFTTTRNTVATRVNENGLIEEVASNVARLDYSDGGCPSLLLEPASTNLVTYSEDFSNAAWNKGGDTVVSGGFLSPDGTNNAYKVSGGYGALSMSNYNPLDSLTHSRTIYAKTVSGSGLLHLCSHNSNADSLFTITEEWQRFEVNGYNSTGSINFYGVDFRGSSTLTEVLIWGASAEANSYATSYIKTVGTVQTRVADSANGAGNASTFNDSSGVLMVEISALAQIATSRAISISNGSSTANRLVLQYTNSASGNEIVAFAQATSYSSVLTRSIPNSTIYGKFAIKYSDTTNTFDLYFNGFKIGAGTWNHSFPTNSLSKIQLADANGTDNPFYGNTKQIQYFDSALTDSELEKITSWTSFTAMANAQSYTII